ncbi:hypothetical protein DIPPA_12644 [Diplonema papillatum]|nr:hypothetical protein DIPPA_12644 [Diplonema papillatum]
MSGGAGTLPLLGLVFLAVSAPGVYEWFDTAYDAARDKKVAEFNAAVESWAADGRRHWEDVGEIMVHDWYGNGTWTPSERSIRLLPSEQADLRRTEEAAEVKNYRVLKYTNVLAVGVPLRDSAWETVVANLTFTTASQSVFRPLTRDPVVLAYTEELFTSNWKQCQHSFKGTLLSNGTRCVRYNVIQSLCVVFELEPVEHRWVFSSLCPKATVYQTVPVNRRNHVLTTVELPASFRITVHAADDPFFIAHRVTDGMLHFGRSHREREVLILLSLLLSGCIVGFSCFLHFGLPTPPDETQQNICVDSIVSKPIHNACTVKRWNMKSPT